MELHSGGAVTSAMDGPHVDLRPLRFEEVAAALRLIAGSVEHGCASAYKPVQRRAVVTSYTCNLFLDVLRPFDTAVAERDGALVAVVQTDVGGGRLRGLFVAPDVQGRGVGQAVLAHAERRAAERGCRRLEGAMSLNAVPFYTKAGYAPCAAIRTLDLQGARVDVLPMAKTLSV